MTTIELTREQVASAVAAEPLETLRPGLWVRERGVRGTIRPSVRDPNCEVCAVGAVMRMALDPRHEAAAIARAAVSAVGRGQSLTNLPGSLEVVRDAARAALARGNAMSALSIFFEGAYDAMRASHRSSDLAPDVAAGLLAVLRAAVVEFVREEFPPTVRFDIGWCEPAPGVRVIEQSVWAPQDTA